MAEHKEMTEQELLSASLMNLSPELLAKRSAIINIRKMERELEVSSNDNEEYQIKKREKIRMREIAIANSAAERAKIQAEQGGCNHKTGGQGLAGWFQGDGAIYGSSTAALQLPTGEIYYLCFRCQKEWHRPSKRAFLNGTITLFEYQDQEKEYIDASRWSRKSFEPWNGEICASARFNIPALEIQRAVDDADFRTFMLKLQDLTAPGPKVEGGRA